MKKQSYKEQLKSPKWQKRRLEIMQRDNFTSQICGETEKQLHVHHTTYLPGRDIWDYFDTHLITVCEDCHTREHNKDENENIDIYLHDIGACGITTYEALLLLEELIGDDSIMTYLIDKYENYYENTERANNLKRLYKRRRDIEKEVEELHNEYFNSKNVTNTNNQT